MTGLQRWTAAGAEPSRRGELVRIASWPETATAVAVRVADDDGLEIVAPFGLADLFNLRLRHNPKQPVADVFRKRVADKRWMERWPELELVQPSGD